MIDRKNSTKEKSTKKKTTKSAGGAGGIIDSTRVNPMIATLAAVVGLVVGRLAKP